MRGFPFASIDVLRGAFVRGLDRLLDYRTLGTYILVHANANFDPAVAAGLGERLRAGFDILRRDYLERLQSGREMPGTPDDRLVFLKLVAIGFDGVQPNRWRHTGPWEVQFNHFRAFRPPRMSGRRLSGISAPFDPKGFHFNQPFLHKEVFWSGRLRGCEVALLYNKFPFIDLHGLLVPERTANRPQLLRRGDHDYAWELAQHLGGALPGVGFGYNSYGAHASVNHLHFQMFVRERPLPVADPRWRHNGGGEDYPAGCEAFDSPEEAWERLDELHWEEISYNLIYLPGLLYLLPRSKQGTYRPAAWTSGFAWYEMAGGITCFNPEDFAIGEDTIAAELARLRI